MYILPGWNILNHFFNPLKQCSLEVDVEDVFVVVDVFVGGVVVVVVVVVVDVVDVDGVEHKGISQVSVSRSMHVRVILQKP